MTDGKDAAEFQELKKRAKRLSECVEYDVNGMHGKGGNGGLVSNETIRANCDLVRVLNKMENSL